MSPLVWAPPQETPSGVRVRGAREADAVARFGDVALARGAPADVRGAPRRARRRVAAPLVARDRRARRARDQRAGVAVAAGILPGAGVVGAVALLALLDDAVAAHGGEPDGEALVLVRPRGGVERADGAVRERFHFVAVLEQPRHDVPRDGTVARAFVVLPAVFVALSVVREPELVANLVRHGNRVKRQVRRVHLRQRRLGVRIAAPVRTPPSMRHMFSSTTVPPITCPQRSRRSQMDVL